MKKYIFLTAICIAYISIFIWAVPHIQPSVSSVSSESLKNDIIQPDVSVYSTEHTVANETFSTESTEKLLPASTNTGAIDIGISSESENNSETESNLSIQDTAHIPATLGGNQRVNLREKPSTQSNILATMKPSEELTILSFYDDTWVMVDYNGTIGYCISACLVY